MTGGEARALGLVLALFLGPFVLGCLLGLLSEAAGRLLRHLGLRRGAP